MKRCYTCKESKDKSEFNKNRSRSDGLNSICRACSSARSRRYYQENKLKHKRVVRENCNRYIERNREFVFQYLITHPCVDCGETNPLVLEFDHIENKEDNISTLVHAPVSLNRLKREIEKCQVRCANCHRIKTAKDFNFWIYKRVTSINSDAVGF